MKKSYWIALALAVAAAGWILSGQFGALEPRAIASDPMVDSSASQELPNVRVQRLTGEIKTNELIVRGHTEASRSVRLKAETAGRIVELAAERGKRVKEGAIIVRIAMDDRAARFEEAKALVAQREIKYEGSLKLQEKGFQAETKVAEAGAQLEAAKAALKRIEVDIDHITIRAPFSGVLDARPVNIGDFVEVGSPVATIVDLDPVFIVGHVSERDVSNIGIGSPARARLITGYEVEGYVHYIANASDEQTRTFRVEVEVSNPGFTVRHGVTSELYLPLPVAQVTAHKVSPAVLSLSDDGVVGIKSVNDESVVEFHPVQIVGEHPQGVWIAGLPKTIVVITVGQEFVKAGQRVQPVFQGGDGNP
jgi:multidrug efflux system membrane fusion protein